MGPLQGIKVIELASIGPGPFACMLLSDMGAEVLRLARSDVPALLGQPMADPVSRGRPTIPVDLKQPADVEFVLSLGERADALVEGFRPGVMERLGLGPDELLARNPRLVFGRMTGYGQDGPLARVAGHDINYISIAGALGAIARDGERPLFPLNLLGDYGAGGMLLGFGVVCALLEARSSGRGQIVDAAMVEGTALLTTIFHGLRATGIWSDRAGTNVLDSGAHFYEVYETSDGRHVAVGALEPQFYAELLGALEIDPDEMPQWDRDRWPEFKQRFAEIFRSRTRAQWAERLEPADACTTPVLGLGEAPDHHHNRARNTFVEIDGLRQPAPAPRFSRTAPEVRPADLDRALAAWGISREQLPGGE
jgi:alpha-methylacyl-CoA racemase